MPGLRSLRNRLAVIFALIILGAIGTIYLSVTPRLEASLTSQRLDQVCAPTASSSRRVAQFLPPKDTAAAEGRASARTQAKDERDRGNVRRVRRARRAPR